MRIPFKPVSRLGKWSAWLALCTILVFLLLIIFAEWLRLIPDLVVSILGSASVLALLAAGVTGLVALVRQAPLAEDARGRDRSILVYIAVGLAAVEIIFIAINILSELG